MSNNANIISDIIPGRITDSEVLNLLKTQDVDSQYVKYVKDYTQVKDDLISEWLNISVKTFRSYKKENATLKDNLKEHLVLLISLFKHGITVFGDHKLFYQWLESTNPYFDHAKPVSFLTTVTGIRFIDDRLTALEYGDNV